MLEKYQNTARLLENNNDLGTRLIDLFFPLLTEGLGYSDNKDLMQKQLFGNSQDIVCEYALVEDATPAHPAYKAGIKLVEPGNSFDKDRRVLENILRLNPNCKYGLLTDGIVIEVFENEIDRTESVGTHRIATIDLRYPTREGEDIFQMLSKRSNARMRQNFAAEARVENIRDTQKNNEKKSQRKGISLDDWDNDDDYESPVKKPLPIKNEEKKPNGKVIIGAILAVLVALALGWFIYSKFFAPEQPGPIIDPNVSTEQGTNTNTDNWANAPTGYVNNGANTSLQYIEIQAMLGTKLYAGNELELSLLNSNILKGTIIKFELMCGNYKDYVYAEIDKNGECYVRYQIPEEWYLPDIGVIAYMRFDEEGEFEQEEDIKKKYGEQGEYIITPPGAPLYAIAYTYTSHENAAVVAYINRLNAEKAAQLKATREKDFSQLEILVDVKGNMRMVPKGYSLTEANIKENRYIYPMITYDAAQGRSYFYIVVGFVGKNWIMFESTTFTADTYSWGYEVSSNDKRTDLSGHALSEWVYFNDYNVPTLLADMNLLANSNNCSLKLTGPLAKTHAITPEEKNNLALFLYIYATYFENGKTVPDIEWFNSSDENTISLSYLVAPDDIRARYSTEVLEMESTLNSIVSKRSKGQVVTDAEQSLYNRMTNTYIPIDMNLFRELFAESKKSDAYAIYDNDYEHGSNSWVRLYFFYDDMHQGTIETGYIPYITIYSNKSVHIPLISEEKASQYDKTLIEAVISPEMYSKLMTYLKNSSYVYYTTSNGIEQEVTPLPYDGSIDSTINTNPSAANGNSNNLDGVGVNPGEFELTGNYFSEILGSYGD